MQFSIKQAALAAALAQLSGVAARATTGVPVLANVYLSLEGNKLTLMATDMEVYARVTVEVEGKADGKTTVSATKFQALVRAMSDGDVTFKLDNKASVWLTSGKSRFKLMTLPASDYPEPKADEDGSHSTLTLPGAKLASMLDKVQRAMANGDERRFLNGVLMELSDSQLRLVATDGHRLSLAEKDLEHDQKPISVILPRKGALEFLKLLKGDTGDVTLSLSETNVILTAGESQILSQAINGKYPDYNAVLPAKVDKPVLVDREALAAAVDRVAITANEKYRGVVVNLKPDSLMLSTDAADSSSGEDVIDVEFGGKAVKLGFNLNYIRDSLASISTETVEVHVKDGNAAALLLPTDERDHSKHVVMPLKI